MLFFYGSHERWKERLQILEWRVQSSVLDGEGSLDRVVTDKEVEDEHAVKNGENFPEKINIKIKLKK